MTEFMKYVCIVPYSTKQVSRFHPPYVLEAIKLQAQHTDQLRINAQSAWDEFLTYVIECVLFAT